MSDRQSLPLQFCQQPKRAPLQPPPKNSLNPLSLIPSILQPENHETVSSNPGGVSGLFVQDHLFTAADKAQKGKRIRKAPQYRNYKTRMCPDGRDCRRRFTCKFAHTENELRRPFMKRTKACTLYQRGQCNLGAACRQYHGNIDLRKNYKYKAEVCTEFISGKCGKGKLCIFSHDFEGEKLKETISELTAGAQTEETNADHMQHKTDAEMEDKHDNDEKDQNTQRINNSDKKKENKPLPKSVPLCLATKELIEQLTKREQLVEDGLTFAFDFSPM